MKTLKNFMENVIGIPLQMLLPTDLKLYPLDNDNPDEAYLFGSEIAKKKIYFIQSDIDPFIESCPIGYFLVGHAGYGCNSYAVYYSRVNSWSRMLFRLGYGGAYMDNDKMAKHVNSFLTNFFTVEELIRGKVKQFIGVDSMLEGHYRILLNNGKSLNLDKSFFENSRYKEPFSYILKKIEQTNASN